MCVLNVKAVVAAFNQEKALIGAFSVIVKTDCNTNAMDRFIHTRTTFIGDNRHTYGQLSVKENVISLEWR